MQTKWVNQWKQWIAPTKLPNVWQRRDGGCFVRARVIDPTTGRMKEVKKVLAEADPATALKWLSDELSRIKRGVAAPRQSKTRFADFALSLLERKLATKQIKSAAGRERWVYTLRHLIDGTDAKINGTPMRVTGFGELFVEQIRVAHIEEWKLGVAKLVAAEKYAPTTANGWLAILRGILKAAKRELELPFNAAEEIEGFDTSEHETYTYEQPNSLTAEEVATFLTTMRELFPQHYAMTYLGFCTGLRPSSFRPLRRSGPTPDVLWTENMLLVRRSQTIGDEVMNTTKTNKRQRIHLPQEVMDVLRWHVETQLVTPAQQESELLFPATDGGFRSHAILKKPFAVVIDAMGSTKRFTARGLRRTFQDLARAASVESLVQKSISGHSTDAMKDHYSTVNAAEQRTSIARVVDLMEYRRTVDAASPAGGAPSGAPPAEVVLPRRKADHTRA